MQLFLYSLAVTKGLKKVTNLFQIGLFPHKKVKFAQRLIDVNSNFLI